MATTQPGHFGDHSARAFSTGGVPKDGLPRDVTRVEALEESRQNRTETPAALYHGSSLLRIFKTHRLCGIAGPRLDRENHSFLYRTCHFASRMRAGNNPSCGTLWR